MCFTPLQMYNKLMDDYGPRGWWPLLGYSGPDSAGEGSTSGYHPGQYDFPRDALERFEICVGAVLTQNTAWRNVVKALRRLDRRNLLDPWAVVTADREELSEAIRPSGYYNVKSRKLIEFATFFIALNRAIPTREALLGVWGIGPETADSILLYGYRQPELVVDAYTKRILVALKVIPKSANYDTVKGWCEAGLPTEIPIYQEFHALVVEHAKQHYSRKPYEDNLLSSETDS